MADPMTAGEASEHYLNSLESEKAREERPALDRFVEAMGGEDRSMREITGDDVEQYAASHAEALEHDADHAEPIRGFLAYASRLAFSKENLVPHLGEFAGGARGGQGAIEELGGEAFYMTFEGIEALEGELTKLKDERPRIADELHAAMADKDFRENAPLDAARDSQAHLEARIREIEGRLRHAVVIDAEAKGGRAHVGSTVRVLNVDRDTEQTFHLVSPSQVDPASGKISVESPVGLAIANHSVGDEVTVTSPAGAIRLRLLEVEG
jgi:transcription elongation factor GreA